MRWIVANKSLKYNIKLINENKETIVFNGFTGIINNIIHVLPKYLKVNDIGTFIQEGGRMKFVIEMSENKETGTCLVKV